MAVKRKQNRNLMSKASYSKHYGVSRPTINRWIEIGELEVENISGVDYIKITQDEKEKVR